MGIFTFFKKLQDNSTQPAILGSAVSNIYHTSEILEQLEHVGYFKYANENDVPELKREVFRSIQKNYLSTIWNEQRPFNSKCFRLYELDGETLFEQGGFTDYLKDFEYLFEKIGFHVHITNHIEEYNTVNMCLDHSMTINQKDYIIFSKFKGYGWGEAAQKFADILNEELNIQGKEERIYLANGGNDGLAIVLTNAQYDLLDPILTDSTDKPLPTDRWCKVMQVNPI